MIMIISLGIITNTDYSSQIFYVHIYRTVLSKQVCLLNTIASGLVNTNMIIYKKGINKAQIKTMVN